MDIQKPDVVFFDNESIEILSKCSDTWAYICFAL
jgi:hypothetical protein